MSVRRRVRNVLIAATSALGVAGIVVVSTPSPVNVALDCRPDEGLCVAILEPPNTQCAALHARDGSAGTTRRVARVLLELESRDALAGFTTLSRPSGACYVEVLLTMRRSVRPDGSTFIDGQAPAWRDVVDATGVGSIVKDGRVGNRPAYALRGGCRAHVWAGQDPCAASVDIEDSADPLDGGVE